MSDIFYGCSYKCILYLYHQPSCIYVHIERVYAYNIYIHTRVFLLCGIQDHTIYMRANGCENKRNDKRIGQLYQKCQVKYRKETDYYILCLKLVQERTGQASSIWALLVFPFYMSKEIYNVIKMFCYFTISVGTAQSPQVLGSYVFY